MSTQTEPYPGKCSFVQRPQNFGQSSTEIRERFFASSDNSRYNNNNSAIVFSLHSSPTFEPTFNSNHHDWLIHYWSSSLVFPLEQPIARDCSPTQRPVPVHKPTSPLALEYSDIDPCPQVLRQFHPPMDSTLLQINKATARPLQPLDHQWFIPRQVEKSERAIGGTHHGRRSTVRRLGEKKESARKSELYKTEMCISVSEGVNCKYGDQCQFAHNKDELKHVERHPRYKTQFCTSFQRDGYCKYNDRCTFIHKAEEARITTGESGLSSTIPRAERRVSAHLRALASTPERGAKISAVSQKTGPATVSMETKATRDRNYLAQDLKPYSYSGKDTDYSSNILSVSESVQNQSFLSSQDMWFHGGVYNESSSTATGSFIFPFDYFQHCVPMSPSNSIDSVNTDTDSGYSAGSTSMRPFATPETQEIIDQGSYLEWGLKLARYISTKENEFDLDSLCSL